jgi:LPS export ABC transporter protein LptC
MRTVNKFFVFPLLLFVLGCSFDYGAAAGQDKDQPDIVMEKVEYVRVRGGDPLVRFQAEHAERWEERQIMELENFSFEQFGDHGDSINAAGRAGTASVQLDSGDITLSGGVRIDVESEDITIETGGLEWNDKTKTLSGEAGDKVDIQRSDGTNFSGRGFSANIRSRTWSFEDGVNGVYTEEEDEKSGEVAEEHSAGR